MGRAPGDWGLCLDFPGGTSNIGCLQVFFFLIFNNTFIFSDYKRNTWSLQKMLVKHKEENKIPTILYFLSLEMMSVAHLRIPFLSVCVCVWGTL